jgi:hypothetical protein
MARALLVLGSLAAGLLGAEILLRLGEPLDSGSSLEHRIPHPVLGWVLEPGASYRNVMREATVRVSYSSAGWRDRERERRAGEGVSRVLVLGDSFMEAYSVELEDSFPHLIEERLRAAGRRVEVLNLGVGGYGTLQEALLFETEGRGYGPELVLLGFYVDNDVRNNSLELETLYGQRGLKAESRPYLAPGDPSDWRVSAVDHAGAVERYEAALERRSRLLHRLAERSALVRRIARKLEARADRRLDRERDDGGKAGAAARDMARHGVHACREPEEWTRAWGLTARILSRLVGEVRASGARLVVFSVPSVANVLPEAAREIEEDSPAPERLCLEEAPGFRRLEELCGELGIEHVELLPAFRRAAREEGLALFRSDDRHWSEEGHRLAAEGVAARLLREGAGPGPGAPELDERGER